MFLIIKQVKLIKKKKFVIVAFDQNFKPFIVYITAFNISFDLSIKVYLLKKA